MFQAGIGVRGIKIFFFAKKSIYIFNSSFILTSLAFLVHLPRSFEDMDHRREMDYNQYALDVNGTARGSLGSFATTGHSDQYPKEHAMLVVACTVAHKALGPEGQSVRPMNFCSKLAAFERECVGPVKEAVLKFMEEEVNEEDVNPDSPKFSPLLAQIKEDSDAIFPWVSYVLLACMKNYHDFMELRKIKQSMQGGYNFHGRGGHQPRGGFQPRGGYRQDHGRYQGGGGGGGGSGGGGGGGGGAGSSGKDYNRPGPGQGGQGQGEDYHR